ncbi:MAG: hypothetical protein J7497_09870, partial [Chitinophagaceae bacterium]|nr:hypothetical protein [Chitinophagaceae bacterium]
MKYNSKVAVIEAYQEAIILLGKIPTVLELRKHGFQHLEYCICRQFGKLSELKKEMGLNSPKKDYNYWTLDQTVASLRAFIDAHRDALANTPISKLLPATGHSYLYDAAQKFKGIRYLNETYQLGLDLPLVAYWVEETLVQEIRRIHDQGYAINMTTLQRYARKGFMSALKKAGPLSYFMEKAGIPVKPVREWTADSILLTYRELCEQEGKSPTYVRLLALGYSDLLKALSNIYGSFQAFRKTFGYSNGKKPANYWTIDVPE